MYWLFRRNNNFISRVWSCSADVWCVQREYRRLAAVWASNVSVWIRSRESWSVVI